MGASYGQGTGHLRMWNAMLLLNMVTNSCYFIGRRLGRKL